MGRPRCECAANSSPGYAMRTARRVIKAAPEVRDLLLTTNPATFYMTPHYAGYPMILVRLDVAVADELRDLLIDAWR